MDTDHMFSNGFVKCPRARANPALPTHLARRELPRSEASAWELVLLRRRGRGPSPPSERRPSLDGKEPEPEHPPISHGGLAVRITSLALHFVGTIVLLTVALSSSALAQPCATDADCTVPLTCKPGAKSCEGGGGILPDGGMYTLPTVCQTQPATCTWVFAACQTDSACTLPNWGCLGFPGQNSVKMCFPKYTACSASQPCPAAWSCIESTQARSSDPGPFWGMPGVSNYCWPDNLAGLFNGTTRTDSTGIGLSPSGTGEGTSSGAAGANGAAGGQGKETGDAGTPLSLGGEGGSMVDSGAAGAPFTQPAPASSKSGCAIAEPRDASAPSALLVLAVVGLLGLGRATRKG
jgi:hypothetical protein